MTDWDALFLYGIQFICVNAKGISDFINSKFQTSYCLGRGSSFLDSLEDQFHSVNPINSQMLGQPGPQK